MTAGRSPRLDDRVLVRLLERPVADDDGDHGRDAGDEAALAGVGPTVAAAHVKEPVTVMWGALDVHGPALWVGSPVAAPSGSRHRLAKAAKLQSRLDGLSWVELGLSVYDRRSDVRPRSGSSLEDILLGEMDNAPVAWVVEARPIDARSTDAWESWSSTAGRGERGTVSDQVEAVRARRLLDLLEAEAGQGLWQARLWCGGASLPAARRLAGLLLSCADVARLDVVVATESDGIPIVPSSVVAAFGRPPTAELPGLRIRRVADWDLTPESRGPIAVGTVLSPTDRSFSTLTVPLSTINRHAFVAGATGSGKSETVRRLLGQLSEQKIPWMVIEPAKAEYHVMADLLAPTEVVLLKPGDATRIPFSLNPLEPSSSRVGGQVRRFPLGTHLSLIRSLFEAAFQPDEPFPQILAAALDRSYAQHGWDLATGQPIVGSTASRLSYPTLSDLRRNALDVVAGLGYGREVSDNVRGFVDVRISSLRNGIAGQFFESGHPLDLEDLADRNVVIQLEDLGNEQDQAFFIGAVLVRWSELLRLRGDSGGQLRHVLVLEEAHRLLRDSGERSHSIEAFANLLAEIRSYGEGVIVAEQIPAKIIPDVIKNSAMKIVHRLPAQEDRDKVGATMNLGPAQSRGVVSLSVGTAAVHADGMDRPIRVAIEAPPTPRSTGSRLANPRHRPHTRVCAVHSGKRPCSVEEIEVGRRLASDHHFAAWVDLAVLSRLVGGELPSLAEEWIGRFKVAVDGSRRCLICAVGLSTQAAVAARTEQVIRHYEPATLEDLVGGEVVGFLVEGREAGRAGVEWQVGHYRWIDLSERLDAWDEPTPAQLGQLVTEGSKRGVSIDGSSPSAARRSLDKAHRTSSVWSAVDLLRGRPSMLAEAIRALQLDSVGSLVDRLGSANPWLEARFTASHVSPTGPAERVD